MAAMVSNSLMSAAIGRRKPNERSQLRRWMLRRFAGFLNVKGQITCAKIISPSQDGCGMPLRRDRLYNFRGLMWAALGFIALTTFAMGYTVWKLRSDAIDDAFKDTGNIATVLAEQIAQTARSIDLVLGDIQDRIGLLAVRTPDDLRRAMCGLSGI